MRSEPDNQNFLCSFIMHMVAPRALVFGPLVEGNEALGTRLIGARRGNHDQDAIKNYIWCDKKCKHSTLGQTSIAFCARNVKRTRTPDLKLTALIKIKHKCCVQRNTVEKIQQTRYLPDLITHVLKKKEALTGCWCASLMLRRFLGPSRNK